MKKFLSLVMALVLVFAMTVTAFAAEVPYASEILLEVGGPSTETGWWFDAWFDDTNKLDFNKAVANGATHLVVETGAPFDLTVEGNGYQIGFQGTDWNNADNALIASGVLWHSNYLTKGEGQINVASHIETVDGHSFIYLDLQQAKDWFAANAAFFDLSSSNMFNLVVGVNGAPTVCVYAVKAELPAAEEAPETEEPAVEETTTEEPAEETTTEEPATPTEEEPAETGLAFAVIPAIIAMAAVVVSKKR